jgi:hypothetical protein
VKVIFSRKGFDSAAGGAPSPIIEGAPISLPIPTERRSETTYRLAGLGQTVEEMTKRRISADSLCHEDPMFSNGGCRTHPKRPSSCLTVSPWPVTPTAIGFAPRLSRYPPISLQSAEVSVLKIHTNSVTYENRTKTAECGGLETIGSRERNRRLNWLTQCGGFARRPAVIGDFTAPKSGRECWPQKDWRRERTAV